LAGDNAAKPRQRVSTALEIEDSRNLAVMIDVEAHIDVADSIEIGLVVAEVPAVHGLTEPRLHVLERVAELDAVNRTVERRIEPDVVQDLVLGEEEIQSLTLEP
jgi:hypothetical protein